MKMSVFEGNVVAEKQEWESWSQGLMNLLPENF